MKNIPVQPLGLTLAATVLLLAACSTNGSRPSDAGQLMSARGEAISARGEAWTDGQRDVDRGQKLVDRSADRTADAEKKLRRARQAASDAQRQIEVAQVDRAKGERMMSGGTAQMQQAEGGSVQIGSAPPATEPQ